GRDAGLAVGVFILINLGGEAIREPFSTLADWISLPGPRAVQHAAALAAAVALIAHGLVSLPERARRGAALLLGGGVICALLDTKRFYGALLAGYFRTPAVIPASILVAAVLLGLAVGIWRERGPRPPWTLSRARNAVITAACVAIAIPLV